MTINGVTWSKLLRCFADEMAQWEDNMLRLLVEMVPGLADWLLTDWERNLGLPDGCSPLAATVEQRRQIAHAKYTAKYSGLSTRFYEELAGQFGSTITIVASPSGQPFRVNKARVDRTPEEGINGARLNSLSSFHQWKVIISGSDPNQAILRCMFNRIKPAHTKLVWQTT